MMERRSPGNNVALSPPMGWNSFNAFGCEPSEAVIREIADVMVDGGYKAVGYEYVNIDDGWMTEDRDSDGSLTIDPIKFPNGLKPLVDYVHGKGLKIGIYLGAGLRTYGEKMGSLGHEREDAKFIASMGFDYLKYDYRVLDEDPPGRDVKTEYSNMRDFLVEADRPMVFSVCEHGRSKPWEWAWEVAHLWRSTPDIKDFYDGDFKWGLGFNKIADSNERLYPFAGPGFWNDPDMLVVGLNGSLEWQGPGCSVTEYRAHFALWCLMAAPLIIGCDLRVADKATRDILLNTDLIAIDQDAVGVQGHVAHRSREADIWLKKLSANAVAVGLYNRSAQPVEIAVTWAELGFPINETLRVRDAWKRSELGAYKNGISRLVESHDCLVFTVRR